MRRVIFISFILCLLPVTTVRADFSTKDEGPAYSESGSILNFNPKELKEKIRKSGNLVDIVGHDGRGLFLTLFALAVLIEMIRMTRGVPDWAGLIVRVLVIVAVLSQYGSLFTTVENTSESIARSIMGGDAFDNLINSQIHAVNKIKENFEQQDFGVTDVVKPLFFLSIFSYLSYLFGIGMHYLYYFAYHIITTGLYFIGPIIIGMAVIKELNFTSGFISSLFTVCSWNVLSALLINLISHVFMIGVDAEIGFGDMFLLNIFNVAYGIATVLVPLFSLLIFSGKNFGVVGVVMGAALLNLASRAAGLAISRFGGASPGGSKEGESVEAELVTDTPRSHPHYYPDHPRFPGYRALEPRRINLLTD